MYQGELSKMLESVVFLSLILSCVIVITFSSSECQTFPSSKCPKDSACGKIDDDAEMCCNVDTSFFIKEEIGAVTVRKTKFLHVYNATLDYLDIDFPHNKDLETLAITGGSITKISVNGNFTNLKCLNLSGNGLLSVGYIHTMAQLDTLDLSQNNLTSLPNLTNFLDFPNSQNLTLDFSGNSQMGCNSVEHFLSDMKKRKQTLKFRNRNTTFCSLQKSFDWFNSTDKVTLSQIEDVVEAETQCKLIPNLHKCHCKVERIVFTPLQPLQVLFHVDCSGLQLDKLPQDLPPNTISLNVSNNSIINLKEMTSPPYSGIRHLYADNNQISSITILEGTSFISNFSELSLRSNNLTSVPTYFLSNSFDRNYASRVHLGGNRLMCDCNTALVLKGWLMSNKKYVLDYNEVRCSNYPKNVVELEQQEVCVTQRSWTDYIYYIIAGEVTLLIFLVSKVSYDYWVFKTAGYLPWPASKMPKLPCDWVFET